MNSTSYMYSGLANMDYFLWIIHINVKLSNWCVFKNMYAHLSRKELFCSIKVNNPLMWLPWSTLCLNVPNV